MRAALGLVILLLAALPLNAQVAIVKGGEHEDFTRVVIEAPAQKDWAFGRTEDGYALQLGAEVSGYDVSQAFEKIPRDRISAIWRDPDTGSLRLSLACACHAQAFEFRTGIIVVDIRTGAPPDGSPFEAALDAADAPPPAGADTSVADTASDSKATVGYDWIEVEKIRSKEAAELPLPLPAGEASLDPLRDSLLAEISKGAAEGVVDIAEGQPDPEAADDAADYAGTRIAVGELPGLRMDGEKVAANASGQSCIADDLLDLSATGWEGAVAGNIGLARSGLVSEFDAPDPDSVLRAARFHVAIGFGAEARQILDLLPEPTPDSAGIVRAMARIIDHEQAQPNPFADMHSCDSAASLWSALVEVRNGKVPPDTDANALVRAFSALPSPLQTLFGKELVDAFLAVGDAETARLLHSILLRNPAESDPETALVDARYRLATGEESEAEEISAAVFEQSGSTSPAALVTLIEAAFLGDRQIDPGLPALLESFLKTTGEPKDRAELLRAKALADAMTGDFSAAFSGPERTRETENDLWSMAIEAAPDDLFLTLAADHLGSRDIISDTVAFAVAERLLQLGFADVSLAWIGPKDTGYSPEKTLLAARAQVMLRNPEAALELLAGLDGTEVEALRAEINRQLGEFAQAAEAYQRSGNPEEGSRTLVWSKDWNAVAQEGPEAWREAAGSLPAIPPPTVTGPIGAGQALADEAAEARATLEALIAATRTPDAGL